VSKKIDELSQEMKNKTEDNRTDSLQEIIDYITLKKILSEKLRRVL